MSEHGFARESFCGDQLSTSASGWNGVDCNHAEVKEEVFFPSEVEVIGIEPLFPDTKYMRGTEDDLIFLNSAETDKYLALEDFPYSDEFCSLSNDSGISAAKAANDGAQVLGSMLEQHDNQYLHVNENLSNLSERVPHEDYKFLLENLRSDGYNENLEDRDHDAYELHDAFGIPHSQRSSIKQHILVGLSSLIDMDHASNAENMLFLSERQVNASCPSEDEEDGKVVKMDGGELTRKRARKPTRRYIEETSEAECTLCTKRGGGFPQDKILHHLRDHAYSCRSRRGRPRKNLPDNLAEESLEGRLVRGPWVLSESENEDGGLGSLPAAQGGKCMARRKHHRLWTLAEVMKLIEGVSKYGVGRWTKIKRLLFSSSGHRTSVDLKDKWRNLLRASGAHVHGGKKEFEAKRKAQSGMVPQSVLRRVRDLAAIHPYPRERSSRESPPPPALSWNSS